MKIYFGFTVAGDRSALETARRLVQLLEGLGHEVLTGHLVDDDAWERDRMISPQDVYRRDMAWLQQCEVLIAEVWFLFRLGVRDRLSARRNHEEGHSVLSS